MGNYSYYCLLLAAAVCAVCTPCHCWCCLLLLFRLFFFIVFFPIYTIYIYVIRIVYVLISPRFFDVRQRLDDPALEPMCRRGHISCRRLTYKCLALGQPVHDIWPWDRRDDAIPKYIPYRAASFLIVHLSIIYTCEWRRALEKPMHTPPNSILMSVKCKTCYYSIIIIGISKICSG